MKSIAVYHGYGGGFNVARYLYLKDMGYQVHYPFIDYDREWDKDRCSSILKRELNIIKDIDVIMGFSLGGYTAFELAGHLEKDVVLVNPALDRSITRLNVKWFNFPKNRNCGKVELFLGSEDDLIDMNITKRYLDREGVEHRDIIMYGMDHNTPQNWFEEIVDKSFII